MGKILTREHRVAAVSTLKAVTPEARHLGQVEAGARGGGGEGAKDLAQRPIGSSFLLSTSSAQQRGREEGTHLKRLMSHSTASPDLPAQDRSNQSLALYLVMNALPTSEHLNEVVAGEIAGLCASSARGSVRAVRRQRVGGSAATHRLLSVGKESRSRVLDAELRLGLRAAEDRGKTVSPGGVDDKRAKLRTLVPAPLMPDVASAR